MKLRNKNIAKIITLILALLVPQKMLAWGVHASIFRNQSTGHTVALLGDRHANSKDKPSENKFCTITEPYFKRLLMQDKTFHLIVEADIGNINPLPAPNILENKPLMNTLCFAFCYPDADIMQIPITARFTLNDERSHLLGKISDWYADFLDCANDLGRSCCKRLRNVLTIPLLKHNEYIKLILRDQKIQKLLLDKLNLDIKQEMRLIAQTDITKSFSAQDILNQLEDCVGQARYSLLTADNPQQKKLWRHYLSSFDHAYNSAKESFSSHATDVKTPGMWIDTFIQEICTRQTIHIPWMDVILDTLAEYGFMVKIIDDIQDHEKTFLYAGGAHCEALKPQLKSIGYTCILEFNCPDSETLQRTEYDQFFTQFFE